MICFHCGAEAGNNRICPQCGANMHVYKRILATSNVCYNEGLEKARVRDLSGAADMLNRALKLNKFNTQARNLLGLVYFEMGEMVWALREWVISQNLQPENNLAGRYLQQLQGDKEFFERTNQSIKKYNQALEYCKAGSLDLAKIQLKRVLADNPKLVSGYQLMTLLCLHEKDYTAARSYIKKARMIDQQNTTTIRYMREISNALKKQNADSHSHRHMLAAEREENMENGVMPRFLETLETFSNEMINIVVGMMIASAVFVFLVIPAIKQSANADAATRLADANEGVMTTTDSVASLERQIGDLKEQLAEYTDKADVTTSYELLYTASAALSEPFPSQENYNTASEALSQINPDLLETAGRTTYDSLTAMVQAHNEEIIAQLRAAGIITDDPENAAEGAAEGADATAAAEQTAAAAAAQ